MTLTENQKFAKFCPKTKISSNFYEIWHLEQIEHADYKENYFELMVSTQDYRFGQIWSQDWNLFQVLWKLSVTANHNAYYEYNTSACIGYRFTMIVDSEHGTIMQTIIVLLIVPCSEWL